jgi:anaerobic ribonucleoside-triphosphate reductase
MIIIKRDGNAVSFDANKIINAINKAFIEVDGKVYENDTATDIAVEIGKIVDNSATATTVE